MNSVSAAWSANVPSGAESKTAAMSGTWLRMASRMAFRDGSASWMVVSEDKKEAVVGVYKVLNGANMPFTRVALKGLNPDLCYRNSADGKSRYGDELMNAGLITTDSSVGEMAMGNIPTCDFDSRLFILKAED